MLDRNANPQSEPAVIIRHRIVKPRLDDELAAVDDSRHDRDGMRRGLSAGCSRVLCSSRSKRACVVECCHDFHHQRAGSAHRRVVWNCQGCEDPETSPGRDSAIARGRGGVYGASVEVRGAGGRRWVYQLSSGQGSSGNVIAALCSFFIPGLGQLLQGRLLIAIVQFVLASLLWLIWLGWIIHLWSILDAALWTRRG